MTGLNSDKGIQGTASKPPNMRQKCIKTQQRISYFLQTFVRKMNIFHCIDIRRSPFMRKAKCIIIFHTKTGTKIKQLYASGNMKIS